MKSSLHPHLLTMTGMLLLLSGCGGGGTTPATNTALHASAECISCHDGDSWKTPGTGKSIVAEWRLSTHMTANGAGCADCHDDGYLHPASCSKCHSGGTSAKAPTNNPDRDGKCAKCHDGQRYPNDTLHKDIGFDIEQGGDSLDRFSNLVVNTERAHFNNVTSTTYEGTYLSSKYLYSSGINQGNCRKCHGPHDPSSSIRYNQDWARSAHGTTRGLENRDPDPLLTPAQKEMNGFRAKTRGEQDFKLYGSRKSAAVEMSDSTWSAPQTTHPVTGESIGVNAVCVRCHTTTGFINFVSSGFSDLSPFEGPGFSATKTRDEIVIANGGTLPAQFASGKISRDLTKELTNCNACHDNGSGTAYDFTKRRKVPAVKIHYNFAGRSNAPINPPITGFSAQYPDSSDSNICITCHSGRTLGLTVKMASARGLDWSNTRTARIIVDHFRGAAQAVFRPIGPDGRELATGFEYYSSASLYKNPIYSHSSIGMNKLSPIGTGPNAGDSRGLGPCIGCHMNVKTELKAGLSSHTFMPVNLSASATYLNDDAGMNQNPSKPITTIVSNACAACHSGPNSWTPAGLQAEKSRFYAAFAAFRELLLFAVNANNTARRGAVTAAGASAGLDADGRALMLVNPGGTATSNNWLNSNNLQTYLRSTMTTTQDRAGYPLSYIDPLDPARSGAVLFPAYTYGAAYNWFMLYYDPGAFAHNSLYVKRLMYDSMDWLDDGILNQSVMDLFCTAPVFRDSLGNVIINSGTKRSPNLNGKSVASYSCADNGKTITGTTDNFNMKTSMLKAGVKTTPNGTATGLVQQAPIDMQLAIDYLLLESAGNRP